MKEIPDHLRYVTSYAEEYVEGESDVSEWESVDEENSEEDSEEASDEEDEN